MKMYKKLKNHLNLNTLIESWPYELPDVANFYPSSCPVALKDAPLRIALIDTGIDISHPCFSGANIVSRDFSGCFNPMDEIGHGTHCAAILVSRENSGMTGLVPETILYSAKIIGRNRRNKLFTENSIVQALKWATDKDVRIILITLGRRNIVPSIKKYIDIAIGKGIVIISVAGNHGGSLPMFPASIPGVVCVSAIGKNSLPLPECYQGNYVDVFAPGEEIMSAHLGGWGKMSGSSQAASIFCGLFAQQLCCS